MGTPSYLGYETAPNKTYEQYLQFDGYPTGRGKDFYEAIVISMMESPSYFIKEGKPNPYFFLRIRHYLKNIQYASHHSFNNKCTSTVGDEADMWEYFFHLNGDFSFHPPWKEYTCTIPWEFTINLVRHFMHADILNNPLDPFWKAAQDWDAKTTPPILRLKTCKNRAFPDSSEPWRKVGILTVKRKKTKSMLYDDSTDIKDIEFTSATFKSDYLTVKKCPQKKLPLLIGTVKTKESIRLLERRLKDGK